MKAKVLAVLVSTAVAWSTALVWSAALGAATEARQILDATGVKGGLVVHVGCGDGKLTAALAASGPYLVHGLDPDPADVAKAREHIRKLGFYGKASVERWTHKTLPYADNVVNLLVAEDLGGVPMAEVMRVLCPKGVAYTRANGKWTKTVKPWPKDYDEWTHFLHGPDNNAVSEDTAVGPPHRLQWVCGPRWARSHDHLASVSALVSSGGRIFYIVDEGPDAAVVAPPRWFLVARDAFNGVVLWKRRIPVWEWHLRGFRSGPPQIARRLVASGDRVYVTLGYGAPVTALDAATGQTLKTYQRTDGTEEIILSGGTLFLVAGDVNAKQAAEAARRRLFSAIHSQRPAYPLKPPAKRLMALDAANGRLLWKKADGDTAELMPTTLAVRGGRLFFQNSKQIICLEAATGKELWRTDRPSAPTRPAWSAPTLVAYDGVVLSADRAVAGKPAADGKVQWLVSSAGGQAPIGDLIAFSAENGKELWRTKCQECYNAPVDVLVAAGLVWSGNVVRASMPGFTRGLDPLTGEVKKTRPRDQAFFACGMGHGRCHRNKATNRYLVLGRSGVEFIDLASGVGIPNHWVRGGCQYGVMPANGLLYTPPHSCACFIECKIDGFNCLAPKPRPRGPAAALQAPRLTKGPAYGESGDSAAAKAPPDDWPTYRHDGSRSGATPSAVPASLGLAWQAGLGGRLSAPVVAGGKVFVAAVDAHAVHALDAADGKHAWSFTAGGRVDSPPTFHEGTVLFGSADGAVYCLRASDGQLVWRFRAAPADRRIVAYGRLESVWPVSGSVLVRDGEVWAAAGRSSYLDGGIHVVRLDARTGRLLSETILDSRDPKTGYQRKGATRGTNLPGALPDILSTDGASVFMRHQRFDAQGRQQPPDVPHLFSPAGFLEERWWHRNYWLVGTRMGTNYGGWPRAAARAPAGRLLVVDGATVYGFGRDLYIHHGSHIGIDGATIFHFHKGNERWTHYRLFALDRGAGAAGRGKKQPTKRYRWSRRVPFFVRAMVLAGGTGPAAKGRTLFIAGPPNPLPAEPGRDVGSGPEKVERLKKLEAALTGASRATLWAVSATDGEKLAELPLDAPPAWDAMAAAGGRLYLATLDGKVLCLAKRD